ncbi:MAG: molybdate ABC transporter substrate-binding protein [Methylocystis sp.]|nr:molybdate ABC transporter substrate-binding protein [Methylocystis sp.]
MTRLAKPIQTAQNARAVRTDAPSGLSTSRIRRFAISFIRGAVIASLVSSLARADEILVAIAANFTAPMQKIAEAFEKETGHKPLLVFGATGKFYAQIKNGAPFEILISSDMETPEKLVRDGLALGNTRYTYAIGKLVLWSAASGVIDPDGDILRSGKFQHLALANPRVAPYGAAGQDVLKRLGVWETVEPKIVQAENIAQAYQFVASGNAEIGFVALSQIIGPNGKIETGSAWTPPVDLYAPIKQDAILLAPGADKPAARALVDYLKTDKARNIIRAYGYELAGGSPR